MANRRPELVLVTSRKLLRRLESKGVLKEPDENERPTLPSEKRWGGSRGYCYVDPPPYGEFRFEGFDYVTVAIGGRSYLYRIKDNASKTNAG